MKIAFFETKEWEEKYFREKLPNHSLVFSSNVLNSETTLAETDFDIVSVFADSRLDSITLAKFPQLKLIASRTTGLDHIDVEWANSKNITVKNVPVYGSSTVAEYSFALLLSLARKIPTAFARLKQRGDFSSEGLTGFDLNGKTLGVVGTGNIGQHVIRIATGFGMRVLAYDAFPKLELQSQLNFKYLGLEELLSQSDIVSLHVPYLDATHHLINQNNIRKFKRGAVLINTSRGSVVETEAIVKALNEGVLSGAALDVLEEETMLKNERKQIIEKELDDEDLRTIIENHVLIGMDNVIVTPHNAFNTREAMQRILETTVENIISFSPPVT